jgi:hypothetical protein
MSNREKTTACLESIVNMRVTCMRQLLARSNYCLDSFRAVALECFCRHIEWF